MKTYEKYVEAVTVWAAKKMIFAESKPGEHCATFHDDDTSRTYYTDNYCAYAISDNYNVLQSSARNVRQISNGLLSRLPEREIFRTNVTRSIPKTHGKKCPDCVIFKDTEGKETAINENFLKLFEKYPYSLKFYQKEQNGCVYVINDENAVEALIMPIRIETLKEG